MPGKQSDPAVYQVIYNAKEEIHIVFTVSLHFPLDFMGCKLQNSAHIRNSVTFLTLLTHPSINLLTQPLVRSQWQEQKAME